MTAATLTKLNKQTTPVLPKEQNKEEVAVKKLEPNLTKTSKSFLEQLASKITPGKATDDQAQDKNGNAKTPEEIFKGDWWLPKLLRNNIFAKQVPLVCNGISLVFNIFSATGELFAGSNKSFKAFTDALGETGYRLFLLTNGTINFLEQLYFKNYLSAFSNFGDNLVAAFAKRSVAYLIRGLVVGGYTLANSLSILNDKYEFDSFEDHVRNIKDGLIKSVKLLFSNPIKNLVSSETGLLGTVSAFLMGLGPILWKLFDSEKLGATVRDLGGALIDLERLKPGHLKAKPKRLFYFLSGASYIFGTTSDYLSKWFPKKRKILVTLNIIADCLGRVALREAQNRGEMQQSKK